VVIANVYERTENMNLVQGQPPTPTSFGYAIEFAGWTDDGAAQRLREARTPAEIDARRREAEAEWWRTDHAVRVRLVPMRTVPGDKAPSVSLDPTRAVTVAAPVFLNKQIARSAEPDGPKTMRWPYIFQQWHRDLYIAVAGDPARAPGVAATLRPGQSTQVGGGEGGRPYTVRYTRLYMEGQPGQSGTTMGAELLVTTPEGRKVVARPGVRLGEGGMHAVGSDVPELGGTLQLAGGVSAGTSEVTLLMDLPGAPAVWQIPLAVTNKPMINLVWLGVILVGLGALLALVRRSAEARRAEATTVEEPALDEAEPVRAPAAVPEPAVRRRRRAEVAARSR